MRGIRSATRDSQEVWRLLLSKTVVLQPPNQARMTSKPRTVHISVLDSGDMVDLVSVRVTTRGGSGSSTCCSIINENGKANVLGQPVSRKALHSCLPRRTTVSEAPDSRCDQPCTLARPCSVEPEVRQGDGRPASRGRRLEEPLVLRLLCVTCEGLERRARRCMR